MREKGYVASFPQRAFWLANELEPGSPAFNLARAFRVVGPIDFVKLAAAFDLLLRRHQALRTSFSEYQGEVFQHLEDDVRIDIERFDLSEVAAQEQQLEAPRLATELTHTSFDLTRAPLFRVNLLRLGPDHHVLVLVLHHIIMDGWSMAVFFDELAEAYKAFLSGASPQLTTFQTQYTDFSLWQREYVSGEGYDLDVRYWKERLAGAPPFLELPTDYPRPEEQTHQGSKLTFEIKEDVADQFRALCVANGVTVFMGLLATFQVFLQRYSGYDDVLVGTPVAGRSDPALSSLIGCFVNTIVLRGDLSGDPTFEQLLGRTRALTLGAFEHQELPFERLVAELQPQRSGSYAPLFQVMLILQNARTQIPRLEGILFEELAFDSKLARYDLTLEVVERQGFCCTLEYRSELFTPETVARMGRHLKALLSSLVESPCTKVSELRMLDGDELRQITTEWNATVADYPRDLTIGLAFEEQACLMPESTALIERERHVSYGELNLLANQVAHQLRLAGLAAGDPVGVYVPRSIEAVAAMLGASKIGAPFVPLEVSQPKARVEILIKNAGCKAVLTCSDLEGHIPTGTLPLLLDAEAELWGTTPVAELSFAGAEHPAYIIFTSGSSGTPKGVVGTHRGVMNRLEWMYRAYPFTSGEVCCQKTSIGFVDSIWEIFGPLLRGIPNIIIPDAVVIDPPKFVRQLRQAHVSRLVLVPTLLRILLEYETNLGHQLPELKLCAASGEYLSLDLASAFRNSCPHAVLLNLYGSSEVAADATFYQVSDVTGLQSIPIGRPISNTQVYILGTDRKPVPIGVAGVIHVGGEGLSPGYYLRDDLTRERFVANPIADAPSPLLFNTGDRGRFLADGNVVYLGRNDDQINVRGIRLEPGEIEAGLLTHPRVSQAAVVAVESDANAPIVAYFVGATVPAPSDRELRSFLRQRLPEYMVPNLFAELTVLPTLPSGKVDRQALRTRYSNELSATRHQAPTRLNEVEHTLLCIWRDLLRSCNISTDDNFFDLGGNSLLATQMIARIREDLKLEVSIRTLFDNPTVAELGLEIQRAKPTKDGYPELRARDRPRKELETLRAELMKLSHDEVSLLVEDIRASTEITSTRRRAPPDDTKATALGVANRIAKLLRPRWFGARRDD